ncbi:hypothetical protein [Inquilinus limosus]|uniref:hypothetical protein n=1 Tax=Inquilinus limosus TaxID=171674 RepID=UPI000422DF79|nr:hypothetical protein [Inquilinus limosus]
MATPSVDQVWADNNPDGSVHEPNKLDIRRLLRFIQALAEAAGSGAKSYPTKAAMDADTSQPDGTVGIVRADPVDANNFPTLWVWQDSTNQWIMGVDRVSNLATALTTLQGIVTALQAVFVVDGGQAAFEFVDPNGLAYGRVQKDGVWELFGGALIGETPFQVYRDTIYSLAVLGANGTLLQGFRMDGDIDLLGARVGYGEIGDYALVITDANGVVLFGAKPDGSSSGGGGGLTPEEIAELQHQIDQMVADGYAAVAAATGPILSYGPITNYAPATAYDARDLVRDTATGVVYMVTTAYTSTSLTADVTAGNLIPFIGLTAENYVGSTTVTDYAALRVYGGPLTRIVVTGEKIAGVFQVRAGDTTSPDDGGGIIVGTDGRRWERICLPGLASGEVTWEMFGADATGITPTETALINCHAFANVRGLRVRQNDGVFLWRSGEIQARTDCHLNGATILTDDQSGDGIVNWDTAPQIFRISGKPRVTLSPSEVTDFNANYKQYLIKGGEYLPFPKLLDYYGGMFTWISDEIHMWRRGDTSNLRNRVFKNDCVLIGKDGNLSNRFVETLTTGNVVEAIITQKEDSFLTFEAPKFRCTAPRSWVGIKCDRPMTRIMGLVDEYTSALTDMESRRMFFPEYVFSIQLKDAETNAHPAVAGSYGLFMTNCVDVHVDHFRGLYGWGVLGNYMCKDFRMTNSHVNRIDFHWGGWDVWFENNVFTNRGARLIGGGKFIAKNNRYEYVNTPGDVLGEANDSLPAIFSFRNDYGCDWDGDIEVDGLTVRIPPTATFNGPNFANATSFDVVRLGYPNADNVQSDVHMPNVVLVKNIVFDFQGCTSIIDRLRWGAVRIVQIKALANAGYKTYLPTVIEVDGVSATNVPANSNAICSGLITGTLHENTDGARNPLRYDGTNADIVIKNVYSTLNKAFIADGNSTLVLDGNPALWDSAYLNATRKWVPRVRIENCWPCMVDIRALCSVDIQGGVIGRIDTNDLTSAHARVKVNGGDIRMIPRTNGGTDYAIGDPAITSFTGCAFFNHLGGGTTPINAVLRGVGNDARASAGVYPNPPATFWIA